MSNKNLDNLLNSILKASKSELEEDIAHYIDDLEDGNIDEIDLFISLRKLEYFTNEVLKVVKDKIDYTKLSVEYKKYNSKIKSKATASRYDFSNCNDLVYQRYKEEQNNVTNLVEDRENLLKSITSKQTIVDEETGDIMEILPPIKSQGTTIEFKLL